MRLIDADKIKYHKQLEAQGNGQYEDVEVAYKSEIDAVPSPKELYLVKHGKWIMKETYNEIIDKCVPWIECSECGYAPFYTEKTAYCGNCGAKMDKE